jgi:hypothetical protein
MKSNYSIVKSEIKDRNTTFSRYFITKEYRFLGLIKITRYIKTSYKIDNIHFNEFISFKSKEQAEKFIHTINQNPN